MSSFAIGIQFWLHNESLTQSSQQNNSNKFLVVYKMDIYGLKQNYKIGQPINVAVNYTGYFNSGFHPDVKVLDINNSQVWSSCCIVDSIPLNVLNSTYVYTLENSNGPPVIDKTGLYTIIASLENKTAIAKFNVVS